MRKGNWWKAFEKGRFFLYLTEFFLSIYRFIYLLLIFFFFGENIFFTSYKPGYVQTNMKGRTPYEFKNNKLYLGLFKKDIHWHCLLLTPLLVFLRSSQLFLYIYNINVSVIVLYVHVIWILKWITIINQNCGCCKFTSIRSFVFQIGKYFRSFISLELKCIPIPALHVCICSLFSLNFQFPCLPNQRFSFSMIPLCLLYFTYYLVICSFKVCLFPKYPKHVIIQVTSFFSLKYSYYLHE